MQKKLHGIAYMCLDLNKHYFLTYLSDLENYFQNSFNQEKEINPAPHGEGLPQVVMVTSGILEEPKRLKKKGCYSGQTLCVCAYFIFFSLASILQSLTKVCLLNDNIPPSILLITNNSINMTPRFPKYIGKKETQGDHSLLSFQISHFLPVRMCRLYSDVL